MKNALNIILLIENSAKTEGLIIDSFDQVMPDLIEVFMGVSLQHTQTCFLLSILSYGKDIKWMYSKPLKIKDFIWKDLKAEGKSNIAEVFNTLDKGLNTNPINGQLTPFANLCPPFIIIFNADKIIRRIHQSIKNTLWH